MKVYSVRWLKTVTVFMGNWKDISICLLKITKSVVNKRGIFVVENKYGITVLECRKVIEDAQQSISVSQAQITLIETSDERVASETFCQGMIERYRGIIKMREIEIKAAEETLKKLESS